MEKPWTLQKMTEQLVGKKRYKIKGVITLCLKEDSAFEAHFPGDVGLTNG